MKIAVQSEGNTENAKIDKRFGRCSYFAFYDDMSNKFDFIENEFKEGGSAGIRSAGVVAEASEILIGINIGPNAFAALSGSGIKIYNGLGGKSIKENVDAFKVGNLKELKQNNAEAHNG